MYQGLSTVPYFNYSRDTELMCRTEKDRGVARLNHRTAGILIIVAYRVYFTFRASLIPK